MEHRLGAAISTVGFVLATAVCSHAQQGQGGDPATLIRERLVSEIRLTKANASHDDIVTAGDTVVLHKDGLKMCSSTSKFPAHYTYFNGALSRDKKDIRPPKWVPGLPDLNDYLGNCSEHTFVAGETFWVTDISVQEAKGKIEKAGIVVSTISEPYNDVRYYGQITFLFPPKGPVPSVDNFVKTVADVITVRPPPQQVAGGGSGPPSGASGEVATTPITTNPSPLKKIEPPPPPPDEKTTPEPSTASQTAPASADASSHPPLRPIAPPPPPPDAQSQR